MPHFPSKDRQLKTLADEYRKLTGNHVYIGKSGQTYYFESGYVRGIDNALDHIKGLLKEAKEKE